jgi:hypothetical protein
VDIKVQRKCLGSGLPSGFVENLRMGDLPTQ